jgi:hypothetical protein
MPFVEARLLRPVLTNKAGNLLKLAVQDLAVPLHTPQARPLSTPKLSYLIVFGNDRL